MPSDLKSYPPTWDGDLLLACRKCRKKLKGEPRMRALVKLKKTVQRLNRQHPEAALYLIGVPCMDLCPKGAVTVCLPSSGTARLSLLRNKRDIEQLYSVVE